jgi:ketosteroid isomerase-like protein
MVGWTRAGQLARGETLSLSTVKRMYSFFSRHEVDKKGKDFYNTSYPSNGRIMWDAWGGDAGFSWSRKIVNREKNMKKSYTQEVLIEEIKDILDDVVNPIDTVVEIPDDEEITKALRPEVTREQMYAVIEHLKEAIEALIETPEEETESEDMPENGEQTETEVEDVYKSDNEGMKEKNGRMVQNCVPVDKSYDLEDKEEPIKKSIWDGTFIK